MNDISLCWNDLRWPLRTVIDGIIAAFTCEQSNDFILCWVKSIGGILTASTVLGWSYFRYAIEPAANERHMTIAGST